MPIRYSLRPVRKLVRVVGIIGAVASLALSLALMAHSVDQGHRDQCRTALAFASDAADIDKQACRAIYGANGEGLYR